MMDGASIFERSSAKMERQTVRTNLIEILRSPQFNSLQVDVSELTEETSLLNEITLDSLQLLEFIVAIENRFQFKINTKKLNVEIFDRFGAVIDFVLEYLPHNAQEEELNAAQTA
jgi:acyl carrier protein